MKKHKIYYYIRFNECGHSVTGYHVEKDTSLNRLKKKWLSELPHEVTPISEGFEYERPKKPLTPEDRSAFEFMERLCRNAITPDIIRKVRRNKKNAQKEP